MGANNLKDAFQTTKGLLNARAACVLAPVGYGKTERATRALRGYPSFWFCVELETADEAYRRFCGVIRQFDPQTAERLLDLTKTERECGGARLLEKMSASREMWFVVDRIEEWNEVLPFCFLEALLNHSDNMVHLLLLGRSWPEGCKAFLARRSLVRIQASELLLSAADIAELFEMRGMRKSRDIIRQIEEGTGGWPAAVWELLLRVPGESEELLTEQLLELKFFSVCTAAEREVLLRLAVPEVIWPGEAAYLLREDTLPDWVVELLVRTPLLHWNVQAGQYRMLPVLRDFLLRHYMDMNMTVARDAFRRAGDWSLAHGRRCEALDFYFQARDYDAMLSVEHTGLLLERIGNQTYGQLAEHLADTCPEDVLARHPLQALRVAYALFASWEFSRFDRLMQLLQTQIRIAGDNDTLGEWHMIAALSEFPNPDAMTVHYIAARELLRGSSRVISPDEPFLFGCPSMWLLFYNQAGGGDATGDAVERMMRAYNAATAGHGSGADALYRGEMACMRCQYAEAEIFAYQALEQGETARQPTVGYGAVLLLGRIAMFCEDMDGFRRAQIKLDACDICYPAFQNTATCACLKRMLKELLGAPENWGMRAVSADRWASFLMLPARVARIGALARKGSCAEAVGRLEAMLCLNQRQCSLGSRIEIYIALACCEIPLGRIEDAAAYLEYALEAVEQDGAVAEMIAAYEALQKLLCEPAIVRHEAALRQIMQSKASAIKMHKFVQQLPEKLTGREREIAALAAEGLRNREIAEKLFLSEATVKNHLKSVFRKLEIDRRSKLGEHLY